MRSGGIDLLKIIAMTFIMSLHIVGHGGISDIANTNGKWNIVLWMWEAICVCAVNIYALSSGYLGYGKKIKISRYVLLWLQVVFFGILAFFIFKIVCPNEVSILELGKALLPITFNQYWYFTAYTAVFIISPILNLIVDYIDKTLAKKAIVVIFVVFSCYVTLGSLFGDSFDIKNGYGVIWLSILYVIGAIIKKYENHINISKKYIMLILTSSWMITWGWKIGLRMVGLESVSNLSMRYTAPTVMTISVCFLLLCLKIKKENKVLTFFSTSTLAAYLFQDSNLMRRLYINDHYVFLMSYNPMIMVILIVCISIAFLIIGTLIDKGRILLFTVCNINKVALKIENIVNQLLNYIIGKVKLRG